MALKHKTASLKLLSLPLSSRPLFSAHIKTTTAKVWFIMLFLFSTSACWWRLFFYSNVHLWVNRCHPRTVYTHRSQVYRSMSHSVICNDRTGLLKSCFNLAECKCQRKNVRLTTLFIPLPKNNDDQKKLYCTYIVPLFEATNTKFPRWTWASLPSTQRGCISLRLTLPILQLFS